MIKLSNNIKKVDLLKHQQVGKVVDNNDPRKLLRLKVYIKGIYEDSNTSKLPWVFPKSDTSLGGKPDSSFFVVPEVDSEILVSWPTGDIYHPFYEGYRQNALTTPQDPFDEDYPNSYGHINSNLEWVKINKEQEAWEIFSNNVKKFVKWDKDGNLLINIPANLIVSVGDDVRVGVGNSSIISCGTNFVVTAGNDILMTATHALGSTGGAGGVNLNCNGVVDIRSQTSINMDAPVIHENSGTSTGPIATPSEVTQLESSLQDIQQQIQALSQKAENIRTRVAAVKDKIGRETIE